MVSGVVWLGVVQEWLGVAWLEVVQEWLGVVSGVVIRGVHSHIAIIDYKTLLHTTTYLNIPLEPIVAPPQKFCLQ